LTKINGIYEDLINNIVRNGKKSSPRGMEIRELLAQTIVLDPDDNVITLKGFETNLEYAKEELAWYLSGSNEISFSPRISKIWKKYSDDGEHANSAYGYLIFSYYYWPSMENQWDWVTNELRKDPDSRRAIINLLLIVHKDHDSKDIPCTIALQYLIRNNKLVAITYMRSNDAYYGFRNDVYCFCELQKKLAFRLGVATGEYYHVVGSMHLYESTIKKLKIE
jgi:thymidylate synthase